MARHSHAPGDRRIATVTFLAVTAALVVGAAGPAPAATQQTVTYTSSSTNNFTVPAGVTSVTFRLTGGRGGSTQASFSDPRVAGGEPGGVLATLSVTPGEVLRVTVGGAGFVFGGTGHGAGFNGGGGGGGFGNSGAGGGGATDVRRAPYGLANRLIVAAGGGGAGGPANTGHGFPGGSVGQDGDDGSALGGKGGGGAGGTPGVGGVEGPGRAEQFPGDGANGQLGVGGAGGEGPGSSGGAGGGGGGGFQGGGGGGGGGVAGFDAGAGGGGGGGSNLLGGGAAFTPPLDSTARAVLTFVTDTAPQFTSANNATFTVGSAGSFTVTASGDPAPTFSRSGTLPAGVSFNTSTGVLSGTPAAGTGGTYPITFTANNGVSPNATQSFTLTVRQGPAITSANATTFTVGRAGTFTVTKTGFPAPTLTRTGTLPTGVTFNTSTGVLSGTPAAGTAGTYPLQFKASNGVGTDATQNFTLTVNEQPEITSDPGATFPTGTASSFPITTTGSPAPVVTVTGQLPGGVTFNPTTDTISGTPVAGTQGTYQLSIRAANGVDPDDVEPFSLVVTGSSGGTLPTLAISDANVIEGNTGTRTATFTITRSGPTTAQSAVGFQTNNGTATAPADYTANSGSVTFAAGETTKTVSVVVNGETVIESNETYTVTLAGATGATISDGTGTGTIVDDDSPTPPGGGGGGGGGGSTPPPATPPNDDPDPFPFSDVPADNVHRDAIARMFEEAITLGTGPNSFSPSAPVSRAQIASFLARLIEACDATLPVSPHDAFDDDTGNAHEQRINQLAAAGIIEGRGNRRFGLDQTLTRAQMASLLVRTWSFITGDELPPGPDAFDDDNGNIHEDDIDAAALAGLILGNTDGDMRPDAALPRDQLATLLDRLLDLARAAR